MSYSPKTLDMTRGVIWKQLLLFSAPLLLGNLFQQLYSTVDGVVVGQFVGKEALAAIGSTTSIVNTLIGFFMGMATGCGVLIAQYFGAKDRERLSRAIHTGMAVALGMGVLITLAGILLAGPLLRLMATPEDVFYEARTYLRIYFAGALGLTVYNLASGIFRSVGNTRLPLYILCLSSALNVILDLLFVVVLPWGIAGAAWATVLSQLVSAVVLLAVLLRSREDYRLRLKELRFDQETLRLILRTGIPVGIQNSLISFSNVFVQSYINVYQSSVMAAWTAVFRVHQFAMMPIQSLAMGMTTFSGQNHGAGDEKRAARGTRTCMGLCLGITAVVVVLLLVFREPIVAVFNDDPEVIAYGAVFAAIFAPFHLCICFEQVLAGAMRGAGDSQSPMLIILLCYAALRQVYLFVVSRLFEGILPIVISYPFCWLVCMLTMLLYYRSGRWKKHTLKIRSGR